jgi:hypothetical protein
MNPALRKVHENMRDLGLGALAHANWHANYAHDNRWTPELAVLQAAHAAELLIKARIAEEHPLLIFEQLPRQSQSPDGRLDFAALFESGRTVQYFELPALLWAATGIEIPDRGHYTVFGKLRNSIQHFAPPEGVDVHAETLRFIYGVIDPFINACWNLFAIDYNEDHEPYVYLMGGLFRHEVPFLVSPEAAAEFEQSKDELISTSPAYRKKMIARVKASSKSRG